MKLIWKLIFIVMIMELLSMTYLSHKDYCDRVRIQRAVITDYLNGVTKAINTEFDINKDNQVTELDLRIEEECKW